MSRCDVCNLHVVGLKSSPYPRTSSLSTFLRSLNLTENQLQTADSDDADDKGVQNIKTKEAELLTDSMEQGCFHLGPCAPWFLGEKDINLIL